MVKTTRVEARPGFRIAIESSDGTLGEIDLRDRLFGPMFEPLRDEALFARVSLDEFGAPCWPNGADIAPDALYEQLRTRPVGATAAK